MARDHELPHRLAAVHPRFRVPHRAEVLIGAVVLVAVLVFDLRAAIGFSSFAVLVYYAIANTAAVGLDDHRRRTGTPIAVAGLLGCLALAATLPTASVVSGVGVLTVGLAGRTIATRRRRAHQP